MSLARAFVRGRALQLYAPASILSSLDWDRSSAAAPHTMLFLRTSYPHRSRHVFVRGRERWRGHRQRRRLRRGEKSPVFDAGLGAADRVRSRDDVHDGRFVKLY